MGTGPADPYSGKLRFIEKPGLQDEGGGGRHVAIRCSDPRLAYPKVKLQRRDLVRVVGVVAPFVPQDGTPSIFILTVPRRFFCCGSLLFLLSVFILWFSSYVSDIFCKF